MKNALAIINEFGSDICRLVSIRVWYHIWSIRWLCDVKVTKDRFWHVLFLPVNGRCDCNNRFTGP
jgi:hypothetical protein